MNLIIKENAQFAKLLWLLFKRSEEWESSPKESEEEKSEFPEVFLNKISKKKL